MSEDDDPPQADSYEALAEAHGAQPLVFNTLIFHTLTDAVSTVGKDLQALAGAHEQLTTTFLTLEKATVVMYELVMAEKTRIDKLEKRVERLEYEKNNPR